MSSRQRRRAARQTLPPASGKWTHRHWFAGAAAVAVVAVVLVGAFALLSSSKPAGAASPTAPTWTNISSDQLAVMLEHKDFALLNVKTPYVGEISGTDLYIPYDQVGQRAAELPADKTARIVVYCRTGHESAIAAQTLLDLGYTNIENLDGGMTAWTASGRPLVQVDRSGG